eukprot:scaffold30938_cov41-Phaeocystis_antarctica.AAC.1
MAQPPSCEPAPLRPAPLRVILCENFHHSCRACRCDATCSALACAVHRTPALHAHCMRTACALHAHCMRTARPTIAAEPAGATHALIPPPPPTTASVSRPDRAGAAHSTRRGHTAVAAVATALAALLPPQLSRDDLHLHVQWHLHCAACAVHRTPALHVHCMRTARSRAPSCISTGALQ